MVVAYLEKTRDSFIEEKMNIQAKLTEYLVLQREHIEFVKLLEKESDCKFEVFTPRNINNSHKKKIEELKIRQKEIEININELQLNLKNIEEKLDEINLVICEARCRLNE